MTEDQFKKLEKFDQLLTAAAKKKFFRYPSQEVKAEIAEIYHEITGNKVTLSRGCSSCSGIRWIERLGKWYKEYKEKHVNK